MTKDGNKDFSAKRLKSAREWRLMSQHTLSERSGYAKSTINRWEKGERVPNLTAVHILAGVLDVNPEWLRGLARNYRTPG